MTGTRPSSAAGAASGLARHHLDEDQPLRDARARGMDFGCDPIEPADGATLRFLATSLRARTVVEIGTGSGVSGLWLLRGMAPDGVLTSIDLESEYQRAARACFRAAGYSSSRSRLINGHAEEVLPRLADGGYDLVFVDAVPMDYPRYLEAAIRLLRPGGVVALCGVLPDEELESYGANRDARALLEVARTCREDERLVPLPGLDSLLLVAAKVL